jgi:hypothetical protein
MLFKKLLDTALARFADSCTMYLAPLLYPARFVKTAQNVEIFKESQ